MGIWSTQQIQTFYVLLNMLGVCIQHEAGKHIRRLVQMGKSACCVYRRCKHMLRDKVSERGWELQWQSNTSVLINLKYRSMIKQSASPTMLWVTDRLACNQLQSVNIMHPYPIHHNLFLLNIRHASLSYVDLEKIQWNMFSTWLSSSLWLPWHIVVLFLELNHLLQF